MVELSSRGHSIKVKDPEINQALELMSLNESGAIINADEIQARTMKTLMLIKSKANEKQRKQMLEATA